MQRIIRLLFVLAILTIGVTSAQAYSSYVTTFNTTYPAAASTLGDCVLCHIDPNGGGTRNGYGTAFASAGHSFTAIEQQDSDGDGYTNIVEIQALTWPGDATSHPTPVPPTCTSFTYSAWGACQSNNTQTRTVTSSSPAGCTGGTPVTSQSCTYVPPPTACTSYTYTLGACQSNGTAPVTGFTGIPAGCSGGATPATSQPCTYVPPPSTGTMPLPTGEKIFTYAAVASPVVSADPAQAEPIGVGSIATGGNTLDVSVNVGPFAGLVNISLREYVPSYSPHTYTMTPDDGLNPTPSTTKGNQISVWKTNVTGINQHVFGPISVSQLKKGLYTLTLTAATAGSGDDEEGDDSFYQWTTHFTVH